MLNEYSDYRSYLKSVLADKVSANPSYSLRAFSRSVKLAPGFVSEVLSGKKKLSATTSLKIIDALKLSDKESEYFQTLVQIESVRSAEMKLSLIKKLGSIFPTKRADSLTLDTFRIISDWYHIAAIELIELKDVGLTLDSVVKFLGISRLEASAVLDRLERQNLIKKNQFGKYEKCVSDPIITSVNPNEALQNFHKQTLTKAIVALTEQTNDEKFIGSETLAFDPKDLAKVNQALEDCFSKVSEIAAKSKNKKQVYHLGIQFFNLSKERKKV